MKKLSTCVALFTVLSVLPYNIGVRGLDWPQWQGPNRDGVWHEQGIVEGIPENGLPIVWRVPLGGGYSGPCSCWSNPSLRGRLFKSRRAP